MHERRYRIVYEDQWLIVVCKPSGMLVISTPKKETNTLTDLLNQELDERGIEANAYPCHRLDRETSGLIIYAKGKNAQKLMMEEFRTRRVKKKYTAFVQGSVKSNLDTLKSGIYNRNKRKNEIAITSFRVLERKKGFTVLDVEPLTGRTNQIRIHMVRMGNPILGESVYAFRKDFKLRFKRLALHARSMEFTHPFTNEVLKFHSDLPGDMDSYIKKGCIERR